MNLVVDDAVEVRLATKTEEEKRRPLGMDPGSCDICETYEEAYKFGILICPLISRPNFAQGRQRLPHPGRLKLEYISCHDASHRSRFLYTFLSIVRPTTCGPGTAHHPPRWHRSASHVP